MDFIFIFLSSPKSDLHRDDSDDTFVDTKTPYISRLVEQKSGRNDSKGHSSDSKPLVEVSNRSCLCYTILVKPYDVLHTSLLSLRLIGSRMFPPHAVTQLMTRT